MAIPPTPWSLVTHAPAVPLSWDCFVAWYLYDVESPAWDAAPDRDALLASSAMSPCSHASRTARDIVQSMCNGLKRAPGRDLCKAWRHRRTDRWEETARAIVEGGCGANLYEVDDGGSSGLGAAVMRAVLDNITLGVTAQTDAALLQYAPSFGDGGVELQKHDKIAAEAVSKLMQVRRMRQSGPAAAPSLEQCYIDVPAPRAAATDFVDALARNERSGNQEVQRDVREGDPEGTPPDAVPGRGHREGGSDPGGSHPEGHPVRPLRGELARIPTSPSEAGLAPGRPLSADQFVIATAMLRHYNAIVLHQRDAIRYPKPGPFHVRALRCPTSVEAGVHGLVQA